MKPTGVTVQMGPPLDGNPPHLAELVPQADEEPCDVAKVVAESGAEILLNFLPTESHDAAHHYADVAIKQTKIGFVNGMPTLIVCDPEYQKIAADNGVPIIGDDVKSQLGGTAIHRALAVLMNYRGIHLAETYQINYAGNTDFANLMARGRSKHKTKQEAVTSLMPYPVQMSTGFTHVPLMRDRKTSYFWLNGGNFGNAPLHFEAKLEVEDSANFAGVIVDMVRLARLALDRGIGGVLDSACAFLTKHPPVSDPRCGGGRTGPGVHRWRPRALIGANAGSLAPPRNLARGWRVLWISLPSATSSTKRLSSRTNRRGQCSAVRPPIRWRWRRASARRLAF